MQDIRFAPQEVMHAQFACFNHSQRVTETWLQSIIPILKVKNSHFGRMASKCQVNPVQLKETNSHISSLLLL